jgi:hypothetical protein
MNEDFDSREFSPENYSWLAIHYSYSNFHPRLVCEEGSVVY